jgi:hypothetical protein
MEKENLLKRTPLFLSWDPSKDKEFVNALSGHKRFEILIERHFDPEAFGQIIVLDCVFIVPYTFPIKKQHLIKKKERWRAIQPITKEDL